MEQSFQRILCLQVGIQHSHCVTVLIVYLLMETDLLRQHFNPVVRSQMLFCSHRLMDLVDVLVLNDSRRRLNESLAFARR